ncbi:MAG: type secretion system protein ImpG [Desulfonauticus sp.]|nr:type secretion system protein ImpG [Desulfonauticus sp.]
MKSVPATSIVKFFPKTSLSSPLTIPKGISLSTPPIEEKGRCIFQTCFETKVYPLEIVQVEKEDIPGNKEKITITLKSKMDLKSLSIDYLDFFLHGDFITATEIFLALTTNLEDIVLTYPQDNTKEYLGNKSLYPLGFDPHNSILPLSENIFPGFTLIQEYFLLPQKFLFLRLTNLNNRLKSTEEVKLSFIFKNRNRNLKQVGLDNFVLYATPVINIFESESEPIILEHTKEKIRVLPERQEELDPIIYDIQEVSGYVEGSVEKIDYLPFSIFTPTKENQIYYQVRHSLSPVSNKPETFLKIFYPEKLKEIKKQTITCKLLCTNGSLTEKIHLGDISEPTSNSPETVEFKNIIPVTSSVMPLLSKEKLWDFISHISLNLLSLANTQGLKKILKFYNFQERTDKAKVLANDKRIDSIKDIQVKAVDKIVKGIILRGREVLLTLNQEEFASTGDMYLFCSVLKELFSQYTHLNSFIKLKVTDLSGGINFTWPTTIGRRTLI